MELFKAILKSIFLGTVQGLTEFLPVSSSGHLVLTERLLGGTYVGGTLFFNLMLHFGTLFAVLIAMRKEIKTVLKTPSVLGMLCVATLPAGLVGLLISEKIDGLFAGEHGLIFLCLLFGATAVLLLLAELTAARRKRPKKLGWGQAAAMGLPFFRQPRADRAMGLMQAVAVLPGISRSGSTIAAGIFAGARAEDASRFSFLMSIPVILGGVVLGIAGLCTSPAPEVGLQEGLGLFFGMLSAAGSGYLALRVMQRAMGRANYKWFALYLLLLSLTVLWLDLLI